MQNKTKILKNTNWQPVFRVIKWLVPFLIALILYKKFYRNNAITFEAFQIQFLGLPWFWYLLLILCAALNWSLEIIKWRFLVQKLEPHSLRKAVKSVLSGVAVSQLLPYRTGEYLGRLAFVSDPHKINAGILSVAGSFSQLLITLFFGIFAFVYIQPIAFPYAFVWSFSLLLVLLVLGYFYMPQFRVLKKIKFVQILFSSLALLGKRDLMYLLLLSLLRYFSFLIPYALLAMHYELGLHSGFLYLSIAVACIYFLQTVSPNFILTDLAIRITVSALVFSGSDYINGMDHIPGMIIYVFNVAIPMCMGAVVLLLLKLKRR